MIEHVQQGKDECVLACIAMVTFTPIEEVRDIFGKSCEDRGVSLKEELRLLDDLGYHYVYDMYGHILENRVYLVTVPSKTKPNGTHRIVIDNMFFQPEQLVYDPQGTDEFTCYTSFEEVTSGIFYDVVEIPYRLEFFYPLKGISDE